VIGRPTPTVWIVDDDLGFVWWLSEIFTDVGHQTVPALSCHQAASLMKRLGLAVDLLIVNPHLAGVLRLLQTIRCANPQVKIIAIESTSTAPVVDVNANATLERPSGRESISRRDWLTKVRRLLRTIEATDR
jgi:DNA-binding NtrC family response regulator